MKCSEQRQKRDGAERVSAAVLFLPLLGGLGLLRISICAGFLEKFFIFSASFPDSTCEDSAITVK
ncbi:MAG: hypothetical protein SOZ52_06110 [Pyramidobacter sp.]|nr:hypothetical protein [Pyramidobacter sp.]